MVVKQKADFLMQDVSPIDCVGEVRVLVLFLCCAVKVVLRRTCLVSSCAQPRIRLSLPSIRSGCMRRMGERIR